jgi:hypothetical protein
MTRRIGLLTAFAVLAASFPATVAAAPVRLDSTQTSMLCDLSSTLGPVGVGAYIDAAETTVGVVVWGPDDAPLAISGQNDAAFDGTTLTARFELVDPDSGQPVGAADLAAVFTPDGPDQDFDSRDIRDGNQWIRLDQTIQFLHVTGTLNLALGDESTTVDLGPCDASTFSQSIFATNPNAWVSSVDQVFIACEWVSERGSVSLLAIAQGTAPLAVVEVVQGDRSFGGISGATLSRTGLDAVIEVADSNTGEPAGSVTASATFSRAARPITDNESDGQYRLRTTGERLSVDGTLTVDVMGASTRLVMNDSVCEAGDVQLQLMEKNAQD